jgi:hypothetical protein
MAPKLYRYLNFNELKSFTTKAASGKAKTASLPIVQ